MMGALPGNEVRNAVIIRMRKDGAMPREIAKALGVSKNVVIGVTNRAGLSVSGLQNQCVLRGSDSPKAHPNMTDDMVKEIRRRYVGRCTRNGAKALAAELGVSKYVINGIIYGGNWKHVHD